MWRVFPAMRAAVELLPAVTRDHDRTFEMDWLAVTVLAFTVTWLLADHTFDDLGLGPHGPRSC
jgi:hypothetical protein